MTTATGTGLALELRRDVEAAVLARGGRRFGRHLRVKCPAHADTHPSCDVDLERGWVCRACHAGGSLRQLAELLGVMTPPPRSPARRGRRVPPAPRGVNRAAWRAAWPAILELALRQQRRLEPYRDVFAVADWLRRRHQLVADARRVTSALGPDDPAAWRLARLAARVNTEAAVIEAALDRECRHVA